MQVLDASSALYAWDNYPIEQFPPLWNWLASEIVVGRLSISQVALEEVCNKTPECGAWLKLNYINVMPITQAILDFALAIKGSLSIIGDDFGGGVGENDLFIIASAKINGAELVTDEKRQPDPPKLMRNYKIPLVCNLQAVKVKNLSFVEYFKRSQQVFKS